MLGILRRFVLMAQLHDKACRIHTCRYHRCCCCFTERYKYMVSQYVKKRREGLVYECGIHSFARAHTRAEGTQSRSSMFRFRNL
jgi:hypothetical protein